MPSWTETQYRSAFGGVMSTGADHPGEPRIHDLLVLCCIAPICCGKCFCPSLCPDEEHLCALAADHEGRARMGSEQECVQNRQLHASHDRVPSHSSPSYIPLSDCVHITWYDLDYLVHGTLPIALYFVNRVPK